VGNGLRDVSKRPAVDVKDERSTRDGSIYKTHDKRRCRALFGRRMLLALPATTDDHQQKSIRPLLHPLPMIS
jgi:hypothetical protein